MIKIIKMNKMNKNFKMISKINKKIILIKLIQIIVILYNKKKMNYKNNYKNYKLKIKLQIKNKNLIFIISTILINKKFKMAQFKQINKMYIIYFLMGRQKEILEK